MVTCESARLYKIPLKACQNSVIEHDLVTIRLSVEWPEKGGDDPRLVMDITEKRLSPPYLQANQLSSILVQPVHHYPPQQQQQENFLSIYQPPPQQQHYHQPHSSTANNHDLLRSTTTLAPGDHNDVSSTTTSILHDVIQPPSQFQSRASTPSAVVIQQIKNDLKSQLSPTFPRQLTPSQQYFSPQQVIQTPLSNMNDSRSTMSMSIVSPIPSIQQMSSLTTTVQDLQQSPTTPYPSMKTLVCSCSLAPNHHEHNCPAILGTKQQSTINLSPETICVPSNNRPMIPRSAFPLRTHLNDMRFVPSTKESQLPITFPNCNFMHTNNLSSDIPTIVSQPSLFTNNNHMCSTMQCTPINTAHSFQPQSFIYPPIHLSNQPNYPTNLPMTIPIASSPQQHTSLMHVRRRKKQPKKKNISIDQDRPSFLHRSTKSIVDERPSQVHVIDKPTSPLQLQNNTHPRLLSGSIQLQQEVFPQKDDAQTSTNLSSSNILRVSTNDKTENIPQKQSSHINSMIRSPVNLDVCMVKSSVQISVDPAEIEEIIGEVVKGKGTIFVGNSSTSTDVSQKQSISPQLVWEQSGPVTTKTYLSRLDQNQPLPSYDSTISPLTHQNVVSVAPKVARSPTVERNEMNMLSQQNTTQKIIKRGRPKSTNAGLKRNRKSATTSPKSAITPPVTSSSTIINTPMLSSGMFISSEYVATPNITKESLHQSSSNELWQTLDTGHLHSIHNGSARHDSSEHIIYSDRSYDFELEDVISSKTDERFNSSTPPPFSTAIPTSTSITSHLSTPISTGKFANTTPTNLDDVYAEYFPTYMLHPSSSTWQENQVTSSVVTPPDLRNTSVIQNPNRPHTVEYHDSSPQTQTPTSDVIQTSAPITHQMNNTDDAQKSSNSKVKPLEKSTQPSNSIKHKPLKHSLKFTKKQQNRVKPTSTKLKCSRCGLKRLVDITQHEFPQQKGLIYECLSCGNNSLQSNVSADERRSRLNKVAADHLTRVVCQFCRTVFHAHNEYLTHLKNDHASNKPM